MMQPEGSILAQIQEILKEEFALSVQKYQRLENGRYDTFIGLKHIQNRIDMETKILIELACSKLFPAVYLYKTCQNCQGDRYVWTGDDSYRCPYCNILGEVRV